MGSVASVSLNRTVSPRPLNLFCHTVLVMSGTSLWFLVRCLCDPAVALAFRHRAASIMPARREHPRRRLRSFLRFAPPGPPGSDSLSVSFVVAVWPPLPRERQTSTLT